MKKWIFKYQVLVITTSILSVVILSYLVFFTFTPQGEVVGVFIGAIAIVITFIQMAENNKEYEPLDVNVFVWLKQKKVGDPAILSVLIKNNLNHHITNPVIQLSMPKSFYSEDLGRNSIIPSHVSFFGYTCKLVFDHFGFIQATNITTYEYCEKRLSDDEKNSSGFNIGRLNELKSCTVQFEYLIHIDDYKSGQMKIDLLADNFAPIRVTVPTEHVQALVDLKNKSENNSLLLSSTSEPKSLSDFLCQK